MFRVQDNVPEVYINDSRDFQLISRIYDTIFSGVKYNIDSLKHASNTSEINSQLLNLLRYKLGFFTNTDIDNEKLRHILQIFPSIIHRKGTIKAIEETLNLWFRLNNLPDAIKNITKISEDHLISIDIESDSFDTSVLDELFSFILPTGYYLRYNFITQASLSPGPDFTLDDSLAVCKKLDSYNSTLSADITFKGKNNLSEISTHVGFTKLYNGPKPITSIAEQGESHEE